MPDINLSQKTNLLEQDPYSYELQDVKKPALFHEMFPYNETPKIAFNYRRVPQNMPDDIFITDTTFRDGLGKMYGTRLSFSGNYHLDSGIEKRF